MKKGNRILRHEEFVEIERKGRSIKTPSLLVFFREGESKARVGISVSKKNGNAVRRNKIKRQLRAIVDGAVSADSPIDLVVVARRSYEPSCFAEAKEELLAALGKLGVQH